MNRQIEPLILAWCDRRELATEGGGELVSALRTVATFQGLPAAGRDALKRLWIDVDQAVRKR